jgi:hypothetical protein
MAMTHRGRHGGDHDENPINRGDGSTMQGNIYRLLGSATVQAALLPASNQKSQPIRDPERI